MSFPKKSASAINRIAQDCIAVRVRLINRAVSTLYDEALRPYGLRISQVNLLVGIASQGEVRPTDLCRALRIEKSTLSRDVELMKRQGWVESAPPHGGKNQILRLTPQGLHLLEATVPAWEAAQAKATELLGELGVAQLQATATRLGFGQVANEQP